MVTATRYGTFLLLVTGVPLMLGARGILTFWAGPTYATHGGRLLQVLVFANVIRLSATPYVMTLIGAGQHRLVILTPVMEGFTNLLASIVGGYMFGALGIALGTLAGSLVGVGGNLIYNMRRTVGLEFRISEYIRDGLLRPSICVVPLVCAVIALSSDQRFSVITFTLTVIAATVATALLFWRFGLVGTERKRFRASLLAPQT